MKDKPLFSVSNTVVKGVSRGRKLGFPTANINCPAKKELDCKKFSGVYVVNVQMEGKNLQGVANVGIPLTFEDHTPRVDIYIIDFEGDIYGKFLNVDFIKKLRDVKKFKNEQELIWQIEKDILSAQKYFNKSQ